MEHITTASLEHLSTRISYLCAFLSITSADAAILRSAQPLITPLIPSLLNAVYTKLLSFDITAKIFVPKDMDDDGRMTMAHPQIVLRKDFLRVGYLLPIVLPSISLHIANRCISCLVSFCKFACLASHSSLPKPVTENIFAYGCLL
jgi:hypothetical protein